VVAAQPKPAASIASELDLHTDFAYRLLRALASLELLTEDRGRSFSTTPAGEVLRSDHPHSLRGLALLVNGPEHYALWKHLPAIVRDGGQNGFLREYGLTGFEYAAQDPEYAEAFDAGMSAYSRMHTPQVLEAMQDYDFGLVKTICDVGGGQGHLLCSFLLQYPHLSGIVLERSEVIKNRHSLWAERLGVSERCQYLGGDMFAAVPNAGVYFLKLILHDWNDAECIEILQSIHRNAPTGAHIFIIEHVIPGSGRAHFSKLFDIHMLCWGTGRERTKEEYTALLHQAGWQFSSIRRPAKGAISVIEGVKGGGN
jgi:hypothetical protein